MSGGDPLWANVTLVAVHENGADAATGFVDSSTTRAAITTVGAAQWDTGISPPTGLTSSLLLNGTTDRLDLPTNAGYNFGSGDFCVELFVRPSPKQFSEWINSGRSSGVTDNSWQIASDGTNVQFWASSLGNGTWDIINGVSFGVPTVNTWQHYAAYRIGSNFYGAMDGVVTLLGTSAATLFSPGTNGVSIGDDPSQADWFPGNMAAVRITKGAARYTASNFTPPTLPYLLAPTVDPRTRRPHPISQQYDADEDDVVNLIDVRTWW